MFYTQPLAGFCVGVFRGTFEFVQSTDDRQDMMGPGGVLFASLVPVAASMSPARNFDDRTARLQVDSIVAAIGVGLKIAVESFQEVLRSGTAS